MMSHCCCGVSLRAGSLIIGYLYLVCAILASFTYMNGIQNPQIISELHKTIYSTSKPEDIYTMSLIGLAICGLYILISSLLLVGIHENQRELVKIFVVFNATIIAVQLISLLFIIGNLFVIIVACLLQAIEIYFVMVVKSYLSTMQNGEKDCVF